MASQSSRVRKTKTPFLKSPSAPRRPSKGGTNALLPVAITSAS
jgi:hypothetical protein